MTRLIFYLLAFLLMVPQAVDARRGAYIRSDGGAGPPEADYSDVIAWYGFETGTATVEESNCNNGDTNWTLSNNTVVDGTAALSGSYGLHVPSEPYAQNNADYAVINIQDSDMFNPTKGAIVMMFRVQVWVNDSYPIRIKSAISSDVINIRLVYGDELTFYWIPAGVAERIITTSNANLALNTTYYLVAMWDETANTMSIQAYDSSGTLLGTPGTNSSSMTEMSSIGESGYIFLGDWGAWNDGSNGIGLYIDKYVSFNGSITRTAAEYLAVVKDNTSCPR